MHWAFLGDLHQPRPLFGIEIAFECDQALDAVEHSLFGFARGAIGAMNFAVMQADRCLLKRQLLAFGIKPQRHRRAGAEPREEQIVWVGTGVHTADRGWLVGEGTMSAGDHFLLEFAASRFAHDNAAGIHVVGEPGVDCHLAVTLNPGADDVRHRGGIARTAEQMIGASK